MSRVTTLAAGTAAALAMTAVTFAAQAAPLPVQDGAAIAGGRAVDQVGWRRGYYGGYRRGYGGRAAGALAAGAALGIIGGAVAASAAPRYGYYGYGYPAYGYAPAYGYRYAPAYGYPAYGYGYPAY